MTKVCSLKLNVIKCECGSIIVKSSKDRVHTCNECGTVYSISGRILIKGQKTLHA